MNILNHKIFRVILFVALLNIDNILSLQTVGLVKVLIDTLLGFLVIYVFSASWTKNEQKSGRLFLKETLLFKLLFLVIFLALMNVHEIVYSKTPNIINNLVYLFFGALLVFYLVPSWKKYDLSQHKSE